MTPSPVRDRSHEDAYVYLVHKMQGLQLDFVPIASNSKFDGTDGLHRGRQ